MNPFLIILYSILFIFNTIISSDLNQVFHLSDSLYNQGLYKQSFIPIKKAYSENKDNADIIFRMSRSYFIKAMSQEEKEDQMKYYYQGFEYAKRALEIDSKNGYANFWYAAYLGRIGELEGINQSIINSYKVKEHALKSIELSPDFNHSYHMMGRWHYELAGLSDFERVIASVIYETVPDGSYDEAVIFFKNAIKIKPTEIRHHFWLAKTYHAMNEIDLSKEEFKIVISLEAMDPEERLMKVEAKEHL